MSYIFKPGDFIVGKSAEAARVLFSEEFGVYARVAKVERDKNSIEIVSFLEQGQAFQGRRVSSLAECEEVYYRPMSKQELENFIKGLFALCTSPNFSWMLKLPREAIRETYDAAVKSWLELEKEAANV